MRKRVGFILFFGLVAACVEPYEFVVHDDARTLVIEAYISDRSYAETVLYPSDGRYFSVKLTTTGDVTDARPEPVAGANVSLLSSGGEVWTYTEEEAGVFWLKDKDFKAALNVDYKQRVVLADETTYESQWESLPDITVPPMGEIGFMETTKDMYVMESSEWVVRSFKGIQTVIGIPENESSNGIHYRWTYSPTWIYKAPLASVIDPGYICWATDVNYLNTFGLQIDRTGGYDKELFFLRTVRNERIFERLSVLVIQQAMNAEYYNFWREMKEMNEGSNLTDVPPFNLETNFVSTTGRERVSGYFGVVKEQARRWYFSRHDLSYFVVNTLKPDCLVDYGGPPAAECTDCRAYSFGKATTAKPVWWQ